MVKVTDNNIYMTRGNTATIDIALTEDGEPYTMREGDKLILSVKRRYPFNDMILEKITTTGSFEFAVIDTYELAFGVYDYDITFYGVNGSVDTVIIGTFEIGGECHVNG